MNYGQFGGKGHGQFGGVTAIKNTYSFSGSSHPQSVENSQAASRFAADIRSVPTERPCEPTFASLGTVAHLQTSQQKQKQKLP
jgi:hypothetical protein